MILSSKMGACSYFGRSSPPFCPPREATVKKIFLGTWIFLLRLFFKVVKKQSLTPFFVFCFLILSEDPFLRGSKNKKWVKNYLTLVSHTKTRVIFCISRESKQKTNFCSMGRIGEGRCSSGRVEWESDRFQRKFLSDILVCLFWNIFYCRSEVFWKYKADMPL